MRTESRINTINETELRLRLASKGKACGEDNIPGEVLVAAATVLGRHFAAVEMKSCLWIEEPLQWKGNRLCELWKG